MSGPGNEYEETDCPEGQKDSVTGETLKVVIPYRERCSKADICVIPCEHKKKTG